MSDAQHYRTKDEVSKMQEQDPIMHVLNHIYQNKWASEKQIAEIDQRVKDRVAECEQFAEESPYPEKNVMYDTVYQQENYPFLPHKI